ncbi:DUF2171 domain-containing protein [Deinococcus yavapaiensis]|uniref:DUF2171 domain-containing protein n=1 Tax=Deinococcus yavapaiensis KR-236 TaxID=694435 RepID=A0A318S7D5_9DEIO|nr:DUF2171 domain-containing protein [Deinococcus yavapaiensis]PYE51100.1 hypothetical protein DES52_11532 [Deinococcus yavapaiensis KR-236]
MNIRPGMNVVNSQSEAIGRVVESSDQYIEIETSSDGSHHWVPVSLVKDVSNEEVCLSGSGDDLSSRWLSKDPSAFREALVDEALEETFPGSDPPSFNPQKS